MAATPAARQQALALPGSDQDEAVILRLEGTGRYITPNKDVTVKLDLPLESIPQNLNDILASEDPNQAFEAWLTHCRIFGEAVVEDGERVIFEVLPAEERNPL
jgi:hypothetical protein